MLQYQDIPCTFPPPRPPGGGKLATVGRYYVNTHSFECVALPTLQLPSLRESRTSDAGMHPPARAIVLVIDEIGKMELFSRKFADLVQSSFERPDVVVVATVPIAGQRQPHLVEALRRRDDCQLFEVCHILCPFGLVRYTVE